MCLFFLSFCICAPFLRICFEKKLASFLQIFQKIVYRESTKFWNPFTQINLKNHLKCVYENGTLYVNKSKLKNMPARLAGDTRPMIESMVKLYLLIKGVDANIEDILNYGCWCQISTSNTNFEMRKGTHKTKILNPI